MFGESLNLAEELTTLHLGSEVSDIYVRDASSSEIRREVTVLVTDVGAVDFLLSGTESGSSRGSRVPGKVLGRPMDYIINSELLAFSSPMDYYF